MKNRIKMIAGYILSLAMVMSVLPSMYVSAEQASVNVAAGKPISVYTSGAVTETLTTWTDGKLSHKLDTEAVRLGVDKAEAPVYGVMDLGAAARIESFTFRSTGTFQHIFGLEAWGTNDITKLADADISSFAEKLAVVLNNGVTVDSWYLQYDIDVTAETPYRYIIFRTPTYAEAGLGGDYWESSKIAHEVYVNAVATEKEVAAGKPISVYTSGAVTETLTTWTDGKLSHNLDTEAVRLGVDKAEAPVYGVMDLGVAARIDSFTFRSTGTFQHIFGLEAWGTNDITKLADADISSFAEKLAVVLNNGVTVDSWYLQYDIDVAAERPYRYIIFRTPTYAEAGLGGDYWESSKIVHEVYVNASLVNYYSTVAVAGISHSTPGAVTNVDTQELVVVDFSDNIDVSSLADASVYVVDVNGNKTSVNPIAISSNKVGIYPGELKPQTTYTVEVSGVIDAYGYPVNTYTSTESFTTTVDLAPAAYVSGKTLTNAALGKNVTVYNVADGSVAGTFDWLTDDERVKSLYNTAEYVIPGTGAYTVLDLGKQTNIASLVISTTGTDWHSNGLSIYGTNDISSVKAGTGLGSASLLKTLNFNDANGYVVENYFRQYHYAINNASYRYLILDGDAKSSKTYLGEIYAYSYDVQEAPQIIITDVNMGTYEGKAWDIIIEEYDGSKTYSATFADGDESKTGVIGFENVEADGGSVAFAIFLHTARVKVSLDIAAERGE